LRVILVHNRYQQPGGEDIGVQDERGVLQSHGHEVRLLQTDNDHIHGLTAQAHTAVNTIYSPASRRRMALELSEFAPDLVHVHNFFPVFSPSVYYACHAAGVPVVQTLHNFRLLCPGTFFFRGGKVCEDCLGKSFAWSGVLHACYRGSRTGSAVVGAMGSLHRWIGTFERRVRVVIALTEFSRQKFIQGGFSGRNIAVKPPFVDVDPGIGQGEGGYALFVGRLSEEKGIPTLLEAWRKLGKCIPLRIVGSGNLENRVREEAAVNPGIEYLGFQARPQINRLMQNAAALIFPSVWYEGVPRTILESFAAGTPVIASRIGAMESLIEHGRSGLHFNPGDVQDLIGQVEWMLSHSPEWQVMRRLARAEYEAKYDADRNYLMLKAIYDRALTRDSEVLISGEAEVSKC
jgi:glycosyltransferase involved in cell wall biosynthesis